MARRVRRTNGPLDLREQAILRAVIEEYVASANPVGSLALVERYGLGVSSATVRSILAELEAAGFLSHPHTSAGRVPTDLGYRYYVEAMVDTPPLTPVEQLMIRHQFGQVEFASEHWFRLAATTLAGLTGAAGLATPAKADAARVRRVDLVATGERLAGLVLVLAEGSVRQYLLPLEAPLGQRELDALAARLNAAVVGRTAAEAAALVPLLMPSLEVERLAAQAVERIVATLQESDAASVEDVFSEGLLNVMEAPEFAETEKLRRVFRVLQDRAYLGGMVHDVTRAGGVRVYIGTENGPLEMHDVSLILAPYGRPGRATGVVGVLGPTRLAYPHAISTVRYVSGLMNELVDTLYA